MLRNKSRNSAKLARFAGLLMLALTASASAQVSESPIKDLTPHGMRAPPPVPANLPLPSAAPRELNGVYAFERSGSAPGGIGAAAAGPAPPARPRSNDVFVECMPSMSVGSAGNPGMIVQTPGRITFIGEGNNEVRRIFLDSKFPEQLRLTRLGYSIGHWQDDTLVIETRGFKTNAVAMNMKSVTRVVERLRKTEGGKTIESVSTIEGIDADGQSATVTQNGRMTWRPDLIPIQVTCEEAQDYSFE